MQEDEGHLLGKKFRSHVLEIERSKKKSLEVFKGNNDKNTPFYLTKIDRKVEDDTITKSSNRDQNKNV